VHVWGESRNGMLLGNPLGIQEKSKDLNAADVFQIVLFIACLAMAYF
jgi:hypothetical protein